MKVTASNGHAHHREVMYLMVKARMRELADYVTAIENGGVVKRAARRVMIKHAMGELMRLSRVLIDLERAERTDAARRKP